MRIAVKYPDSEDVYFDAQDAFLEPNGALLIVGAVPSDEDVSHSKTVGLSRSIDRGPDLPPGEEIVTHRLLAMYAPGAWTGVVYG